MDEFDKTIRLLHESTHDKKIREALLIVYDFKTKEFGSCDCSDIEYCNGPYKLCRKCRKIHTI